MKNTKRADRLINKYGTDHFVNLTEKEEDLILYATNVTEKNKDRAKRMARKRKQREHEYEIMFERVRKGKK